MGVLRVLAAGIGVSLTVLISFLAGCGDRPIGVGGAGGTGVWEAGAGGAGGGAGVRETGAAGTSAGVPLAGSDGTGTSGGAAGTGTGAAGTGAGAAGTGGARVCDEPPIAPSCRASCETPAGGFETLASVDAAYTVMQGRWQFCDDRWKKAVGGVPDDAIGVEWGPASREPNGSGSTVGGMMYYLVAGPSGLERGRGLAYQYTYQLLPQDLSSLQVAIHPAPNSGFWIRMRYSPCPNELEVRVFYDQTPTTMVRFPGCGG